jgi:hypothetical protein
VGSRQEQAAFLWTDRAGVLGEIERRRVTTRRLPDLAEPSRCTLTCLAVTRFALTRSSAPKKNVASTARLPVRSPALHPKSLLCNFAAAMGPPLRPVCLVCRVHREGARVNFELSTAIEAARIEHALKGGDWCVFAKSRYRSITLVISSSTISSIGRGRSRPRTRDTAFTAVPSNRRRRHKTGQIRAPRVPRSGSGRQPVCLDESVLAIGPVVLSAGLRLTPSL